MEKVKVYEYNYEFGERHYTFFVDPDLVAFVQIKGRKRIKIDRLFKRAILEKRVLCEVYVKPDREFKIEV